MYPATIQKLIDLFSKFPTVGPRTAARFVFYLLKKPKEEIEELINSINNLKKTLRLCSFCFNPFEDEINLCSICSDSNRNRNLLCLIEKEIDLISLEKTKKYNGLYFILGGTLSNLKKENIKKLRVKELEERIKNPEKFGMIKGQFKEIIIALNPTIEGQSTSLYLERLLKPLNVKITRLGRGLALGAELEYADEETLSAAFEGRK